MIRILQSLLALISLLLLALMSARAESAPWQATDPAWQGDAAEPAMVSGPPRVRPGHRCLVPGPQPGTHFQGQPFAYGYFGARAQTAPVYHHSANGDWFQWSFYRGD
jgi:hypothetical protein